MCTLLAHVNTESSGHLLSVILLPHSASPFSYEDRCSHVNCWLPIRQRFIYKLSALTYKALHTGQPCYLGDLIDSYEPSRCLRSTNCHLHVVPSCVKSSFGSRAFCVSSPNNWNSLPLHICSSDSLVTSRLKSHLFSSAYHV